MSKRPPPSADLPPEITVLERGDDGVKFLFPARPLGPARHVGWLFLAAGALFLYWVVHVGVRNVQTLNRPVQPEDYVMLGLGAALGCLAYFPLGLGLAILAGRREVELRGGKLRTTERVGFLWRTKRWPLAMLDSLQIVGFVPSRADEPDERTLVGRLDALSGVQADGVRFMVVPGYPRRLLVPFAAELVRRCGVRFNPAPYKPLAAGLGPADTFGEWNADGAARPAASKAVLEEYPEGVTIALPPLGFRGGAGTMFVLGVVVAGFAALTPALVTRTPPALCLFIAAFAAVGVLVALHGVRMARRRTAIAVVGPKLLVMQTGLVGSQERTWEAGDLAAVRVGPSGIKVDDEDVLELQIVPRTGPKYGLLAGRDVAEIAWIAGVLRRYLSLPGG